MVSPEAYQAPVPYNGREKMATTVMGWGDKAMSSLLGYG
jgi:hypothetical protein